MCAFQKSIYDVMLLNFITVYDTPITFIMQSASAMLLIICIVSLFMTLYPEIPATHLMNTRCFVIGLILYLFSCSSENNICQKLYCVQ